MEMQVEVQVEVGLAWIIEMVVSWDVYFKMMVWAVKRLGRQKDENIKDKNERKKERNKQRKTEKKKEREKERQTDNKKSFKVA